MFRVWKHRADQHDLFVIPSNSIKCITWTFKPLKEDTEKDPDCQGIAEGTVYFRAKGYLFLEYGTLTQNEFLKLVMELSEKGESDSRHPENVTLRMDLLDRRYKSVLMPSDVWEEPEKS